MAAGAVVGVLIKKVGKEAAKRGAQKAAMGAVNRFKGAQEEQPRSPWRMLAVFIVSVLLFAVFITGVFALGAVQAFGGGDGAAPDGCVPVDLDTTDFETVTAETQACVVPPPVYGSGGVANGAWGGWENGRIDPSALQRLSWDQGEMLRPDAAQALETLNTAYKAEFGVNLSITDSYRTYDQQVVLKGTKGGLAATPGKSNHGWGLAVDLGGGIERSGTPQHVWMEQHAAAYGWVNPRWAQETGSKPEAWHWEFVGSVIADGGTTPDGAKALAQSKMSAYGWTSQDEFSCLDKLWTRESGWRYNALNASSGAYGIPQSLPASKMAAVGDDYLSSPATQITWGMNYIQGRYKTPCAAWAHSEDVGWY